MAFRIIVWVGITPQYEAALSALVRHGSSYMGECEKLLNGLAGVIRENLEQ